jgi:hypothetical protein
MIRQRQLLLLLLITLGGGCAAKIGTAPLDYSTAPRLPSPSAGTYARHQADSPDPIITALVGSRALDASLSGAAAGLALGAIEGYGGLTGWEVREALWQAGYPYPIESVRGWTTAHGEAPPQSLAQWLEQIGPADDIGLVRANGPRGVAWVGLHARPQVDIGLQPRSTDMGASLSLPALATASYRAADPLGNLLQGSLKDGVTLQLIQPGEWLIEVQQNDQLVALFPVYVDIEVPEEPLIEPFTGSVIDENTATTEFSRQLAQVRTTYGLSPWTRNILLDKAAKKGLTPNESAQDSARAVGYSQTSRLYCASPTIEDCLDSMIWDPELRGSLLSEPLGEWGIAAEVSAQSLRFELLLSLQPL